MFNRTKESFPKREERIEAFWHKENIFQRSLTNRKGAKLFSTYDGPPFATGLPHYGHLLSGTIKDVTLRYKTMQGFFVPRRFGWDCHGLPVENEIEKARELSGASAIENFGIAAFNEECRSIVLRYVDEWKTTVSRMGRFIDFKETYKTMDCSFMESVWWVFKELWKKDLIYQGFKVMPFSAKLGTPLSNFEANLNYRDVDDPSITVMLPLLEDKQTALLVWTTTPWTLPSNLAAIINEKLIYVKVWDEKQQKYFILSKGALQKYFLEDYQVVDTFLGAKLKGKRYRPLFDYFTEKSSPNAFTILADDFVGEEEGTGIVHAAPAFGETDFFVCSREKIEAICPVDQNGKFTAEVPDYEGLFVKDADTKIIRRLKGEGSIFRSDRIRHRYPFCWRSDTPLIYKAVQTWFVAVEKIKDRLIAANQKIHWVPDHVKEGRFGKWLENVRDWAISRNRYWGTPIPVWRSKSGKEVVMGSVSELESYIRSSVTDLHRHHVDSLTFEKEGEEYTRIPEVFDCWFESGSMPYAQNHYPFQNKAETEQAFPADFVAEGLDQTRGWFYTLNVLSTALFDKPAFHHVIVNGIILAEDGNKMSKRLKNYPEPKKVIEKYGADAVRLYLLQSPATQADDLRFVEKGVEVVFRQIIIPFWNAYAFLATYAEIYKWEPKKKEKLPTAAIDRWILSQLENLALQVEKGMDSYILSQAVEPFVFFIDQLTNWYIRRSRTRFWAEEESVDREEAFATLYTVLIQLAKIAAPFLPFLSEAIYLELRSMDDPISVHLCDFPKGEERKRDVGLEEEMAFVQKVVSMGHSLRKKHRVKVRQPLSKAVLISSNQKILEALQRQKALILAELNVKDIALEAEERAFVRLQVKPNFRMLGKKVGALMPEVKKAIASLNEEEIKKLYQKRPIDLSIGEEVISLLPEEVMVDREIKEGLIAEVEGEIAIALDTQMNEELLLEGLARELINKLNTQRRDSGLEVTDRITITIDATERLQHCFTLYREYILGEVLGTAVHFRANDGTKWDLNGEMAIISIEKIAKKT